MGEAERIYRDLHERCLNQQRAFPCAAWLRKINKSNRIDKTIDIVKSDGTKRVEHIVVEGGDCKSEASVIQALGKLLEFDTSKLISLSVVASTLSGGATQLWRTRRSALGPYANCRPGPKISAVGG